MTANKSDRLNLRSLPIAAYVSVFMLLILVAACVADWTDGIIPFEDETLFTSSIAVSAYLTTCTTAVIATLTVFRITFTIYDMRLTKFFRVCMIVACAAISMQSGFGYDPYFLSFPTVLLGIAAVTYTDGWRVGLPMSAVVFTTTMLTMWKNWMSGGELLLLGAVLFLCFAATLFICRNGASSLNCLHTTIISTALFSVFAVCDYMFFDAPDLVASLIPLTLLSIGLYSVAYVVIVKNTEWKKREMSIERDMTIARSIQLALIPRTFPEADGLSVYGFMEPALNVGGDVYNFRRIGPELYMMMIGDVSDKRLPATLYMMNARGIVNSLSMVENDPRRIMEGLNTELCSGNVMEQFMTCWIGVLDMSTGLMVYANGGHTQPFVRRDGGEFEAVEMIRDPVVGFFDGLSYSLQELRLGTKSTVFVYTDGVTEAADENRTLYGEERLSETLNALDTDDPHDIVDGVRGDISSFIGNAQQSDDIAMLCTSIDRTGYESLEILSRPEGLGSINAMIEEKLEQYDADGSVTMNAEIIAEELFANICHYAYGDGTGDVIFHIYADENKLKMTFEDSGFRFDPAAKEDVKLKNEPGEWEIGGLGIHMAKKLSHTLEYKYFCGRNITTSTVLLKTDDDNSK